MDALLCSVCHSNNYLPEQIGFAGLQPVEFRHADKSRSISEAPHLVCLNAGPDSALYFV
jgi:hypothetical protein